MKFLIPFSAIFLIYATPVSAQNLVPNPGFEESPVCPGGYNQSMAEFRVKDWRSANAGTPDHFHACSVGEADVPHNWAGVSDAYEGQGYIGIYAWMNNGRDYREFVQCKLISPLVKDSLYRIQFRYKLSSYSKYSIDRMGILLSDSLISWRGDRAPNIEPTFHALQDSALTENTGSWETSRWEFRAKGGEQFLTIGNFYDDYQTHHYMIRFREVQEVMLKGSAYYYLDEILVQSAYAKDSEAIIPEFTVDHVQLNIPYVLKNIQFEFDSYKLISSSFNELDALARFLLKHQKVSVQLSGHTDDIGGDRYNTTLSRNRARSVAQYLMLQGIVADRIEVFGYGKSRPLKNDGTDAARKVNRRVEIRFVQ